MTVHMVKNSISLKVVALTLSASILLATGVYGVKLRLGVA